MGILQAGILEWVVLPFSRGPFQPGIKLGSPAFQVDSLPSESPGKPKEIEIELDAVGDGGRHTERDI